MKETGQIGCTLDSCGSGEALVNKVNNFWIP